MTTAVFDWPVRVRPLNKWPVLVEMIPRYADALNPLGLTWVDRKKHFEGDVRWGRVVRLADGVSWLSVGDVVVFKASAGFTLDGDVMDPEHPLKGETFRWLRQSECLAVEKSA